jgi:hypothetical protein
VRKHYLPRRTRGSTTCLNPTQMVPSPPLSTRSATSIVFDTLSYIFTRFHLQICASSAVVSRLAGGSTICLYACNHRCEAGGGGVARFCCEDIQGAAYGPCQNHGHPIVARLPAVTQPHRQLHFSSSNSACGTAAPAASLFAVTGPGTPKTTSSFARLRNH